MLAVEGPVNALKYLAVHSTMKCEARNFKCRVAEVLGCMGCNV